MCRHLASAQRRAEHDARSSVSVPSGIDALLARMGSKTAAAVMAPPPFVPRAVNVGEAVWDPSVANDHDMGVGGAGTNPSMELLRARAFRRLQAAAEAALLAELGDTICGRLELLSRVTLRKGNGLIDRWLASRREHATKASDPLLPPPHRTAADVPAFVAELEAAGASAEAAAAAAGALGSASTEALQWLHRQQRSTHTTASIHVSRPPPSSSATSFSSAGQKEGPPSPVIPSQYTLKCGKASVAINEAHLLKLHGVHEAC